MRYEYKDDDYIKLEKALDRANFVCKPDEYQCRLNDLSREIAEFLLEPYYEKLNEMRNEKQS